MSKCIYDHPPFDSPLKGLQLWHKAAMLSGPLSRQGVRCRRARRTIVSSSFRCGKSMRSEFILSMDKIVLILRQFCGVLDHELIDAIGLNQRLG